MTFIDDEKIRKENNEKLNQILALSDPVLLQIKQTLDEYQDDGEEIRQAISQALSLIANVKRNTGWGKVALIIQNRRIEVVQQEQTSKIV